ncbi:MAG TPA: GntR family transcriptional regulator [Streptosporangiaceae bacterium]|nr:GntR family transcriptional regulator [Streptosporangiaceae bacterium]
MGTPHVGWAMAADDDESPPQPRPPSGSPELPGRVNSPYRERGVRGSRKRAGPLPPGPAVSVLADRLAAALVHHEPGWRLPRHSALARRYNVSVAEIDAAVEELVSRHLVRRLADGQLYRASPAEYVIGLEGVPGLASYVDAMGGELTCRSRQVTWRLPPEDIVWALRLEPDQQVCVVRFLWTAGGEPAALCTSYVPADIASRSDAGTPAGLPAVLNLLQLTGVADELGVSADDPEATPVAGAPTALHIELQAPPPSVARSLRLTAGQPAIMVTVRFDEMDTGRPVALTIAVLRPDMFRVVVETPRPPLPDGSSGNLSGSWAHAAEDWES